MLFLSLCVGSCVGYYPVGRSLPPLPGLGGRAAAVLRISAKVPSNATFSLGDKEVVVRGPGEVDDPLPPRQSPELWSAAFEKVGKLIGGGDASELIGGGRGGGGDAVVLRPEDPDSEEPDSNPFATIWRKMSESIDNLDFAQVVILGTAVWKLADFQEHTGHQGQPQRRFRRQAQAYN